MGLVIFLYLLLGVLIIWSLYNKSHKLGFVGGYSGFIFSMLVYYIFIPIIVILNENTYRKGNGYGYDRLIEFIFNRSLEDYLFYLFIVIIGFIGFNIGYGLNF